MSRRLLGGLCALLALPPARAFLGFGDTSFVTVIANPAEAANWAEELEQMNRQLTAATATLATVNQLRAYAGDPGLAAGRAPDLAALTTGAQGLAAAPATAAALAAAWQAQGAAGQAGVMTSLLAAAGTGSTMTVFGQAMPRAAALYRAEAADAWATGQLRNQIAAEQATRAALTTQLAGAWERFRAATTTAAQQAILIEIGQLQAQDQAMAAHRQALVADQELADRAGRDAARVRGQAADESRLAESALLRGAAAARAQAGEAQRLVSVQKPPPPSAPSDYSALRLWTTADTGSP